MSRRRKTCQVFKTWQVWSGWSLLAVIGLLAAACAAPASPTATPAPATPRFSSRLTGQVLVVGQCLRLQPSDGSASRLLVFPPGFTASVSGGTIQVSDWSDRKQFLWQPGDGVDLGGDAYDQLDADLLRTAPAQCPGPYWVVGEIAAATPGIPPTATPVLRAPAGPTATPVTPITREQAIEKATLACRIPNLVLVGAPSNIRAQLVTMDKANQLFGSSGTLGLSPGSWLWLVQMDGQLQLVGGPMPIVTAGPGPTAAPPTPFAGTCTALLDAATGRVIGVRD